MPSFEYSRLQTVVQECNLGHSMVHAQLQERACPGDIIRMIPRVTPLPCSADDTAEGETPGSLRCYMYLYDFLPSLDVVLLDRAPMDLVDPEKTVFQGIVCFCVSVDPSAVQQSHCCHTLHHTAPHATTHCFPHTVPPAAPTTHVTYFPSLPPHAAPQAVPHTASHIAHTARYYPTHRATTHSPTHCHHSLLPPHTAPHPPPPSTAAHTATHIATIH